MPPTPISTISSQSKVNGDNNLKNYYKTKIEDAQQLLAEKNQNVRRLQAQRNELNSKVRMLKEELMQLHEQGSYVGEVSKVMDKNKVLVKVRAGSESRQYVCFRSILKENTWSTWTRVSTSISLMLELV